MKRLRKIRCLLIILLWGGVTSQAQEMITQPLPADTLTTKLLSPLPAHITTLIPYDEGILWAPSWHYNDWRLHQGLNAQFTLNSTFGIGKHSPSGVGFGSEAAFFYALPLNRRLSVAGGLYVSNFDWGGWHTREAGVAGTVAYRLNERVNLYAYGNKTFLPNRTPPYLFPNYQGDCIGGMVDIRLGRGTFIQVGIEQRSYPGF